MADLLRVHQYPLREGIRPTPEFAKKKLAQCGECGSQVRARLHVPFARRTLALPCPLQAGRGAYPSPKAPVAPYAPETIVPIRLKADELEAILTKTVIATSEELRPRLEAMAAEGTTIDLNVNEWSCILLALSGLKIDEESDREHLVDIGRDIAARLAETLGIDPPADNE